MPKQRRQTTEAVEGSSTPLLADDGYDLDLGLCATFQ